MVAPPVNLVARGTAASLNQRQRAGSNAAQQNGVLKNRHQEGSVLHAGAIADEVGNGIWTAEFFIPMVATPIAWLAGKIPFVGDRAKSGVNLLLKKPFDAANTITVGDVVGKVTGNTPIAALHGPVPTGVKISESVVASTGKFVDTNLLSRRASKAAIGAFTNMHKDTGEMLGTLGKEGGGMLAGIGSRVKGVFGAAKPAMHATPDYLKSVESHLQAFHGAVAGEAHLVDTAAAHGHLNSAMNALNDVPKGAGTDKMLTALTAEVGGMQKRLHQAGNLATSARGQQSLASAVKTGVRGASLRDVGVKGGLGLGVLYYGARTVTGFGDNLKMLKEMNSDITGKPTSTMDVLRGNLDGLALPARSNMLSRFGPEALTAAASAVTNLVFMRRHMGGMAQAAMFGSMGVQMSVAEFMPKENYLDSYFSVKDMQASGMDVPVEAYAELIAAASKEAQEAGGAGSRLVLKVAEEYAERAVAPTVILKEIHGKTQFQHRAEAAMEKIKIEDAAAREEAADQVIEAKQATASEPQVAAEQPKGREVPGTAMLAAQAADHQGKVVERSLEKGGA